MLDAFIQLGMFFSKVLIVVLLTLVLVAGIIALFSRGKQKITGKLSVKNLNKKFTETTEALQEQILTKKQFKKFNKQQKAAEKARNELLETTPQKNIFVLNFNGDIKASPLVGLREEVTAILGIAKPQDEVVVNVESGGGMVNAYGLAAAQLQRFRQNQIPLTVIVDKVAASGGYMMASIANKIIAAPFAIIGSIGVVVQLPNFHRLLKENHVDFEQITAGSFKRTLTLFGENTREGRAKLQEEINDIHGLFKQLIHQYRPHLDMNKVATGEYWLGSQALELGLVDELNTSDDYLLKHSNTANIYSIQYQQKKSLSEKLTSSMSIMKRSLFHTNPLEI